MADTYGWRFGPRVPRVFKVDSTSAAIAVGDAVDINSDGYILKADAGDIPIGIAMGAASVPAADGETEVEVDTSPLSVYEYPPDAGTVTQALVGKTMDLGGARSINIDASTDDCVQVVSVDIAANTLHVQFRTALAFTGVV